MQCQCDVNNNVSVSKQVFRKIPVIFKDLSAAYGG